jgi:hypothetical protein
LQNGSRSAKDQPRAVEHYSGSGDGPSRHEMEFTEDPSIHETEFAEDPPKASQRRRTRKSHYVAPPPVPTDPESQPIIKPVGER